MVLPISLALSSSIFKSSPVAPLKADTLDIPASKSLAVFIAPAPKANKGNDTAVVIVLPTVFKELPKASNLVPALLL